jgi:hypothetical protein
LTETLACFSIIGRDLNRQKVKIPRRCEILVDQRCLRKSHCLGKSAAQIIRRGLRTG